METSAQNQSPPRPTAGNGMLDVAILLNRLSLGAFFFLAGLGKLRMGVDEFYRKGFLGLKPSWLPDAFASPYGHALPFLEVAVGGLLIIGLATRLTAGLAALLLASFTIALYAAGMFFKTPGPFHYNVILIAIAILLATLGSGRISLDHALRRGGPPR